MSATLWSSASATAIGSMPGTDALEAARVVVGELPELVPLPELPQRGVGADILGRTAGLLVDLAVEVVPSGYRVAARAGSDQRRATDWLRWDVDAMEQAVAEIGQAPPAVKVQAAGPWTLAAGIELHSGHRVLTDHAAVRDFASSLVEGLSAHAAEVAHRTGSRVVVQLDEPYLPSVLAGGIPTPSGYGNVPALPEPEVERLLTDVITNLADATGSSVVVHCCGRRPPVALFRRAGAAVSLDATALGSVTGAFADELGEAWQEGAELFLGLVPASGGDEPVRALAQPGLDLVARLGFPRRVLVESAVVTPTCGLAGVSPVAARSAIRRVREVAELFREELDR